jgi:hypothetical protein
LCEVEVNIFSSCQLKLDVLHSSDLEFFLLWVANAVCGNACSSLSSPFHIGSYKILCYLAVESALPQLSGQLICSTGCLCNIYFQQTWNVGVGFFHVNAWTIGSEVCLFPLCSKTAFKLTLDESMKSSAVQWHVEAEVLPSAHRCCCSIPDHHP